MYRQISKHFVKIPYRPNHTQTFCSCCNSYCKRSLGCLTLQQTIVKWKSNTHNLTTCFLNAHVYAEKSNFHGTQIIINNKLWLITIEVLIIVELIKCHEFDVILRVLNELKMLLLVFSFFQIYIISWLHLHFVMSSTFPGIHEFEKDSFWGD